MLNKIKNLLYSSIGLVIIVVMFLIFFSLFGSGNVNENNDNSSNVITPRDNVMVVNSDLVSASSEPVRLSIPKINIDTTFESPLDIEKSGEVKVPDSYDQVGWYKHSPTPGELGPSVILGHVDSKSGPAVFFSLGQLKTDDDIYIERIDGSTAHFKVDYFERYEQKEFPTELVYGNIDHAGLRLVTCSGIYVQGQQRYTHNLVVYARLIQ